MSSWVRRIRGKEDDDARLLLLLSLNPSLSLSLSLPPILAIITALHFYPTFLISHPSANNFPHIPYQPTPPLPSLLILFYTIDWIVDQLNCLRIEFRLVLVLYCLQQV